MASIEAVICHFNNWPQSGTPSVFGRIFGRIVVGFRCLYSRKSWVSLFPEPLGDFQRFDLEIFPPCHLIADLMQLTMMTAAERDGEFITDFKANRSGLGKPQVMRIGRLTAADETGLGGHKPQMGFVAQAFGFGDSENALVDAAGDKIGGCLRRKRRSRRR